MTFAGGLQKLGLALFLLILVFGGLTNGRPEARTASAAGPYVIYGVAGFGPQNIVSFSSANPGTILSSVPITGLLASERIVGIDFRPSTGVLYGVGFAGGIQHVYTINTTTGVATAVNPVPFTASLSGNNFAMTFIPTTNLIRLISPFGTNLRLDADAGQVAATDNPTSAGIVGAAQSTSGLYVIDYLADTLGVMANGNTGLVAPVGPLGVTAEEDVGFDFAPDDTAYASIKTTSNASDPVSLYQIYLITGAAVLIGSIGSGLQVTGIAVYPGHATATTVTTSAPGGSTFGNNVTFTATVIDTVSGTPATSGPVSFFDGASPIGTVAVNGAGQATLTTSSLSVGPHTITGNYSGAPGLFFASSGSVSQTINSASHATSTSVTTSAPGGATFGNSVTFTATVIDTVSGTPVTSGSVSFFDGATPIVTVAVNGVGQATLTTSSLSVGPHTITANYGGAAGLLSSSGTVSQTVNPAVPTTATLTVRKDFVPDSSAPVIVGVSCTAGATVAGVLGASEAAPAVFTVTNVPVGGTTCTATELFPPIGYTANQAPCAAVVLAQGGSGTCTITNTLTPPLSGTFTVNKLFSPASAASVQVSLTCTAGTVAASPLSASTAVPAVFTVNSVAAGNTCTATEVVPSGYTANQAQCAGKALIAGGTTSCTITNTQTLPDICAGLPNCISDTNQDPGGRAFVRNGGITATCQGTGSVAVALYPANPVGPTTFRSGSLFDVKVSSPNVCSTVTIVNCDLHGATSMQWWNPALNGGLGGWSLVSNQIYKPGLSAAAQVAIVLAQYRLHPELFVGIFIGNKLAGIIDIPACVTMVLTSNTSPSINQLTGTVFAEEILPEPNAEEILPVPNIGLPQIFQNPSAISIIQQGNRNPTPRPTAAAPATSATQPAPPAVMPLLRPPNTGDAGLANRRGLRINARWRGSAEAQGSRIQAWVESSTKESKLRPLRVYPDVCPVVSTST